LGDEDPFWDLSKMGLAPNHPNLTILLPKAMVLGIAPVEETPIYKRFTI